MRDAPPRKAFILAAGFGTRMQPLSLQRSKCLFPIWDRPLLEQVVSQLEDWGVREILINMHHGAADIFDWVRHRGPGAALALSYEPDILGTGGALRRAAWFLGDSPVWIVNGDIVFSVAPGPFIRSLHRHPSAVAAAWVTDQAGPRTVEVHSGIITNFKSPRPASPGTFTFAGLQLVRPALLEFIPETPFSSLVTAYECAAGHGHPVQAVTDRSSLWADTGTPEGYLEAHRQVWDHPTRFGQAMAGQLDRHRRSLASRRRRGVCIEGFACIPKDAVMPPGARLRDVVLWEGVTLAATAQVNTAVIGPGVTLTARARRLLVRPEAFDAGHPLRPALARLGWSEASTVVQPLEPRGSARQFYRLIEASGTTAIAAVHGEERPENARYASHARFLARQGIRVPRVLIDLPQHRCTLFEDLGERDLQKTVAEHGPVATQALYASTLAMVARLHDAAKTATGAGLQLEPPFCQALYTWEHQLFLREYIDRRPELEPHLRPRLVIALDRFARRLRRQPQVLVHRDLQASNVLLPATGEPALIDFQGMRLGPAAYDLASLLCDPYVMLPEAMQTELLALYADSRGLDTRRFTDVFWHAAGQRLVQAIGAFGRLSSIAGLDHFRHYILPALTMLQRAIRHLDNSEELDDLVAALMQQESSGSPEVRHG